MNSREKRENSTKFLALCEYKFNGVRWPSYHRHHYLKGSLPPICTSQWITSIM